MIRTLFITLGCLLVAGLFSIPAAAQGVEPPSKAPRWRGDQAPAVNPATFQGAEETGRYGTTFGRGLHKLGRGVLNFFTGPLEIPKRMAMVWRDTDPVTGIVVGGIEGFGWFIARSMTGAYDVLTFPIPVPANYAPLMDPEFVLPEVWGASVPGFAGDR